MKHVLLVKNVAVVIINEFHCGAKLQGSIQLTVTFTVNDDDDDNDDAHGSVDVAVTMTESLHCKSSLSSSNECRTAQSGWRLN